MGYAISDKIKTAGKTIWFDFENTPHAWILKEFISEYRKRAFHVIVTARDFSSTVQLSNYLDIPIVVIGSKSSKKNKISKLLSVIIRSFQLYWYLKKNKISPALAVSHGSRSQMFAAFLARIKSISLDDYEFSFTGFNRFVFKILTPFAIPKEGWGNESYKVINYPGLKEELYLWNKDNYSGVCEYIKDDKINVVFRPEGMTSLYSSSKSQVLQEKIIDRFASIKNLNLILLARNEEQRVLLKSILVKKNVNFIIPDVLNGLTLIFNSDLLIGGGGTMTREAAILNIPSYSFFAGTWGAVDLYLKGEDKLFRIENADDIEKIKFEKRKNKTVPVINKEAYNFVRDFLLESLD